MKNYTVRVLLYFIDAVEKVQRRAGTTFKCTKERYEYLSGKNLVALEKVEEIEEKVEKPVIEEAEVELKIEEKPKKATSKKKRSK